MFFKLRNDIPFMVYFHTANTVFFNTKKIMMLACLHKYRGRGSCTHWPCVSILQGLTLRMGHHFCKYCQHIFEQAIFILISRMILYTALVLKPFQTVASVLHKKMKDVTSHLTNKRLVRSTRLRTMVKQKIITIKSRPPYRAASKTVYQLGMTFIWDVLKLKIAPICS